LSAEKNKNDGAVWALCLALVLYIPVIDSFTGKNLPYDYFMFLRFAATAGFIYITYKTFNSEDTLFGILPLSVAAGISVLLYNPIVPFTFPREVWTGINIVTGLAAVKYWSSSFDGKSQTNNADVSPADKKNAQFSTKPSNSFERAVSINFDKDVIAPLRLQKSNFSENFYLEKYDRLVSHWTLGYIQGFMAYATFRDVSVDRYTALPRIKPLTEEILTTLFSEKELPSFKLLDKPGLSVSPEWIDGFEAGLQNCQSWQQNGEVTTDWLDFISGADGFTSEADDTTDLDQADYEGDQVRFQENVQNENISKVCSLIVEPLLFQRAMIQSSTSEYLKSNDALGYVSGYTDQFLQLSSEKMGLAPDDEDMVMALVMGIVFEDTENKTASFYDMQRQNVPDFQAAQFEGARSASKMLTEGGHLEAGMAWFEHAQNWQNKKESLSTELDPEAPKIEIEENSTKEDDHSFFDYFGSSESPHVKDLRSYFLRAFGTSERTDLPNDFAHNEYIAGFSIGFFSIVLDAVKDGINWSTEKKGQYGIIFFMELFNDKSSLNLKCLRDKEFASQLSVNKKFSQGREHGSLLAAAHYQLLKKDLSEPLIDVCRNLTKSSSIDMPTAVFSQTLQPFVLSEWPQAIKQE